MFSKNIEQVIRLTWRHSDRQKLHDKVDGSLTAVQCYYGDDELMQSDDANDIPEEPCSEQEENLEVLGERSSEADSQAQEEVIFILPSDFAVDD